MTEAGIRLPPRETMDFDVVIVGAGPAGLAAAIDQVLRASGPGRMGGWIDVEVQGVARFPIGGAGEKLGPVGHDHLDQMVFWVNIGFHRQVPV